MITDSLLIGQKTVYYPGILPDNQSGRAWQHASLRLRGTYGLVNLVRGHLCAHLDRKNDRALSPVMLHERGASRVVDLQLLLHCRWIVVRAVGTIAADIGSNSRQHSIRGRLKTDHRPHVNDGVHRAGLPQVTRQTVQYQPGMVAAADHEPLEYPRCQWKMLVLQQRPRLQDLAEELQILATYMFIGMIAGDQFAQVRPEIEVQAGLPSPPTDGEHVPQRRLAGSRRPQQEDGGIAWCGGFPSVCPRGIIPRRRVILKPSCHQPASLPLSFDSLHDSPMNEENTPTPAHRDSLPRSNPAVPLLVAVFLTGFD